MSSSRLQPQRHQHCRVCQCSEYCTYGWDQHTVYMFDNSKPDIDGWFGSWKSFYRAVHTQRHVGQDNRGSSEFITLVAGWSLRLDKLELMSFYYYTLGAHNGFLIELIGKFKGLLFGICNKVWLLTDILFICCAANFTNGFAFAFDGATVANRVQGERLIWDTSSLIAHVLVHQQLVLLVCHFVCLTWRAFSSSAVDFPSAKPGCATPMGLNQQAGKHSWHNKP